jgi:hypothetical protein
MQVTSSTTTASTTWTQILTSGSWTTNAATNFLIINMSASLANSSNSAYTLFQITLDGIDILVTGTPREPAASALTHTSAVIRVACTGNASHTVVLNWRVSAGTATINPTLTHASGFTTHHCNVVIQECAS